MTGRRIFTTNGGTAFTEKMVAVDDGRPMYSGKIHIKLKRRTLMGKGNHVEKLFHGGIMGGSDVE